MTYVLIYFSGKHHGFMSLATVLYKVLGSVFQLWCSINSSCVLIVHKIPCNLRLA